MSVGLFQRCDLLQVFGDGDVQCRLLDRFAGCFKPGAFRNGSQALSDGVEADVRVSSAWAIFVSRVGGHLDGRFWMGASPTSWGSGGNASRF
jgi:hypothetical protein